MTTNNDQFSPDMVAEEEMLTPFDVRDSSGRQGLMKLMIGTAILLAIAFVILKFYQPGVRDRDTPPRITAENTPFKVKPEEPGGMQVPDQDRGVFDVMDGKTPEDVVKDVKTAEVPIKLPERTPSRANIQVDPPKTVATAEPKSEPTTPRPEPNTPATKKEPVKAQPTVTPPRTGSSDYVVQVASVRSQADAEAVWRRLEQRFPALLGAGISADIKRVDLAEKGIYYRTRIAGLESKSTATELCNTLKASNQACYVTKR